MHNDSRNVLTILSNGNILNELKSGTPKATKFACKLSIININMIRSSSILTLRVVFTLTVIISNYILFAADFAFGGSGDESEIGLDEAQSHQLPFHPFYV